MSFIQQFNEAHPYDQTSPDMLKNSITLSHVAYKSEFLYRTVQPIADLGSTEKGYGHCRLLSQICR